MIDVFDLWQTLMSTVNAQQNGLVRPWDFTNWTNAISMKFFQDRVNQFGKAQTNTDELSPFTKYKNIMVQDQSGQPFGIAAYPEDYVYYANSSILRQNGTNLCGCRPETDIIDGDGKCIAYTDPDYAAMEAKFAGSNLVEVQILPIEVKNWPGALDHKTKAPSFRKPAMTQYDTGFKIAPKDISLIILSYFVNPVACVFAYTVDANDTIIYDEDASVQLQWPISMKEEFIKALVAKYMTYTRDGEGMGILAAGQQIK